MLHNENNEVSMLNRHKNEFLDTTASSNALDVPPGNRIGATARIWGIAVAMLLVCVAVSTGHMESAVYAILIGAAVGTAAVWGVFNSRITRSTEPKTLKEINERLANVETIVSYEEKLAEAKNLRLGITTE
jgi:hypothetical protein